MKILYIVGQFSYPFKVGAMQYISIIEYMSQHHECDVIAFPYSEDEDIDLIRSLARDKLPRVNLLGVYKKNKGLTLKIKKIKNMFLFKPQGFAQWDNSDLRKKLELLIVNNKYNLIHLIYFPSVAQYIPSCHNVPTIITLGDSFSLACMRYAMETQSLFERMMFKFASMFYRSAEQKILPMATKSHVVAENDRAYLKNISSRIDVVHIPLHISREYELFEASNIVKNSDPSIILIRPFGSGFSWFISEVYPLLIKAEKNLRLTILSQEISENMLKTISGLRNIKIIRWADDFSKEVLKHHTVVLTDSFGTGMSTRVLTCMALGMPVVGTTTAFRGVSFNNGTECFIEDDTKKFSNAIISLLSDKDKAYQVGQSARKAVLSQYSYDIIMSKMDNLYREAIEDKDYKQNKRKY